MGLIGPLSLDFHGDETVSDEADLVQGRLRELCEAYAAEGMRFGCGPVVD